MHAEWTIRACEAGKHVLCEKPIALSPEEVDAIARAAQENNVIVTEAYMYRYHPQTEKVLEIVNSGQLGEIRLIRGAFSFKLDRPDDFRWKPQHGGGSIWDIGCYPVSYTRMLTGEPPEEVFGWQNPTESGVDGTFIGQMRFSGGILAQFASSFQALFHTQIEIQGTEGNL